MLTPAEKDEYKKECKKIQEGVELNIQRVETIYGSYTSVLAKSNLMLSDDELQFLKELIITQTPTFDFLGVTKPNSSFSRPLYFIEVKSRSAKTNAGYARVSPCVFPAYPQTEISARQKDIAVLKKERLEARKKQLKERLLNE